MAPTATRAAVSRALARSRMLRMSSCPYFTTPARSAWPGRGRVTRGRSTPSHVSRRLGLDGHRPLPVLPILVRDDERNRAARGDAEADAAQDLRAIGLDRHATPAPVPGLTTAELRRDAIEVERETRRKPFEDRDERLAMRLTGGEKSQHRGLILSEKSAHSFGPETAHRACFRARDKGRDLARRRACSDERTVRHRIWWPIGSWWRSTDHPVARWTWRRATTSC